MMRSVSEAKSKDEVVNRADEGRSNSLMPMKAQRRVMICCVTFETVKVTQPIDYIKAEKIYILHYGNPGTVYAEFYDEVVKSLRAEGIDQLEDVNIEVFRFSILLEKLVSIMTRERADGNDVYVNISAGTSEFAAAATVAAMMVEGVKPFTVHVKKYTIKDDEGIRKAYFESGKPVGVAKEVRDPVTLPVFPIEMPPRDLVVGLRILRERVENRKSTKYGEMIRALTEAGVWEHRPENLKRNELQAAKMYYSRHFIDGWVKQGWISGKEGRGKPKITDSGNNVTEVFYKD